jgi:hypothetical protein
MTLQARQALPRLTDRLSLSGELRVSPFCLGAIRSRDAVPLAFEAGINFFFISVDLHWPLYEELRQGLDALLAQRPSIRDQLVVAAVSYVTQPAFAGANFAELLHAVPRLERIDLVVVGAATPDDLEPRKARYLGSPFASGLGTRAVGASFHSRPFARSVINADAVDVAFVRHNPHHPGGRADLFPHVRQDARTLLFNFRSMLPMPSAQQWRAMGLDDDCWIPEPVDCYRYALSPSQMSGILGSVNSAREIDALAEGLSRGPLSFDEETYFCALAQQAAQLRGVEVMT